MAPRRALVAGSLLLTAFLVFGCASAPPLLGDRRIDPAYASAVDQWTRHARRYSEFSTLLSVQATYRSEAFRRAYTDRYAGLFLLDAPAKAAFGEREESALRATLEFFVCVWSSEDRLAHLSALDPPWRILLADPTGAQRPASRVERAEEPLDRLQSFFPYVTPWCSPYRIVFERRDAEGHPDPALEHPRLIFTGARGSVELAW